jgi:hypothetical protein
MIVKTVMIVLCTAGVAFYARFLIALLKETKPRSTGYWVRLRLSSPKAEKTGSSRGVSMRANHVEANIKLYDSWWSLHC